MGLSNKKLFVPVVFILLAVLFVASCAKKQVIRPVHKEVGIASWYGPGFHGRRTASGERFNQKALTAAHPRLPFGTMVKVTNLGNRKEVVVKINDRGPHIMNRVIDLSKAAARELDFMARGTAKVEIEILSDGNMEKRSPFTIGKRDNGEGGV